MQDRFDAEHPELGIQVLHVNETGYEAGNGDLAAVTDLPILQDSAVSLVWQTWGAVWRDVFVLNGDNELHAVFNLTDHPLDDEANFEALYQSFLDAAVAK